MSKHDRGHGIGLFAAVAVALLYLALYFIAIVRGERPQYSEEGK